MVEAAGMALTPIIWPTGVNPEWAGSTPVKDEAHVASGNLAPVAGTTDRRIEFRISIDVGGVGVK